MSDIIITECDYLVFLQFLFLALLWRTINFKKINDHYYPCSCQFLCTKGRSRLISTIFSTQGCGEGSKIGGGYRIFTDQLQNLPTKKSVRVFFLIHTKAYIDFSEAGGPRSKPDPPSVFAPKARKFLGAFPRICPKDPQKTGLSKRPKKKDPLWYENPCFLN